MLSVKEAEQIVQDNVCEFGTEIISFELSPGRIIAEDVFTDRDMPPFNRATMDGIAIKYDAITEGIKEFHIAGVQAAGDEPLLINDDSNCIEIMTGAALHDSLDTVIRYEDLIIEHGKAKLKTEVISKWQSIHQKGVDKKKGELLIPSSSEIHPEEISILASVGKTNVSVKKLPTVVIISTGDELVDINENPNPFQIRRSNNYMVKAVLEKFHIIPEMMHISDDLLHITRVIEDCLLKYDVIILSGGVSMGKFDHIPKVLVGSGVTTLFHKVKQRPGKPFFFGRNSSTIIFGFPGNPVSTFFCLYRYFIPWLNACLGKKPCPVLVAALQSNINFIPAFDYFIPVQLSFDHKAQLNALPIAGNGSGDFANLLNTHAFMELPAEQNNFAKGEIFRIWPFSSII